MKFSVLEILNVARQRDERRKAKGERGKQTDGEDEDNLIGINAFPKLLFSTLEYSDGNNETRN